jgi:hypothetical protein
MRPTSAAVARSLASPLPCQFSAGRAGRNRSIGTCADLCRREAAPGSDKPRSRGKSVVRLGPCHNLKSLVFNCLFGSGLQNPKIPGINQRLYLGQTDPLPIADPVLRMEPMSGTEHNINGAVLASPGFQQHEHSDRRLLRFCIPARRASWALELGDTP